MNRKLSLAFALLLLSTLACEPVFVIGWQELFLFFLLIAILLGPPLYRLLRRMEKFWKTKKDDE